MPTHDRNSLPQCSEPLSVWYTAIAHSLVDPPTWMAWADGVIGRRETPPVWVCDMSATRSREVLLRKLYDAGLENKVVPGYPPRCDELEIAAHCLRYYRSEISTSTFVRDVFMETDPEDGPFSDLWHALGSYVERKDLDSNAEVAVQIWDALQARLRFAPTLLLMIETGDLPHHTV